MTSKILYLSLIPSVMFSSVTVDYFAQETTTIDKIHNAILQDIANVSETADINIDSTISFEQRTLKQLFVLNLEVNWKKWKTINKHHFSYPIHFDLDKMEASSDIFPSTIQQTFYDPDPLWCDPAGAKWNKKTKTVEIKGPKSMTAKISKKTQWYGNDLSTEFNFNETEWINDCVTLSYPNHSYGFHQIRMYVSGYYKKEAINKHITVKQIENKNIIKAFLQQNKMPATNDEKVWNSQTIEQHPTLFTFNNNLKILKTINYALNLFEKLTKFKEENTKNNIWTNKNISQSCIEHNLAAITNYAFNNYDDLIMLDDCIFKTNREYYLTGNFESNVNHLKTNLIQNSVIDSWETLNTLSDFSQLYEILVLFFKNNKITANLLVNGIPTVAEIWNGMSFCNVYEQISQNNYNLLSVQFDSLNIEYINNQNLSKEINDNWVLNKQNYDILWIENLSFEILYRNDARNINSDINTLSTQNGILLNLNKYLSELIGTGDNVNGISKNEFVNDSQKNIKRQFNNLFEYNESDIIETIYDISNKSKSQLLELIEYNSIKQAAKKLKIEFNDWFNYQPSNYNGIFFVIVHIKNWKFDDNTDGDFTHSFKESFFNAFNRNSNNIIELESKNNDGFFLCKLRTNKILFEYFNDKPIVQINNIETVKSAIDGWYKRLIDENNWEAFENISYHSSFIWTHKTHTTKYRNKILNKLKELNITIHIDSLNFGSPNSADNKQFIYDCINNPLLKYINYQQNEHEFRLIKDNEKTYLVNNDQNDIAININLWDFFEHFYDEKLHEIIDKTSFAAHKIFDYIQTKSELTSITTEDINWFPLIIVLIGSGILFTLCILIILLYKHKKNNLN